MLPALLLLAAAAAAAAPASSTAVTPFRLDPQHTLPQQTRVSVTDGVVCLFEYAVAAPGSTGDDAATPKPTPTANDKGAGDSAGSARVDVDALGSLCVTTTRNYWAYEVCFARGVRQFHDEDVFSLGSSRSVEKDGTELLFRDGTPCEPRNGFQRQARVKLVCSESAESVVFDIQEPQTCEYEITVALKHVCSDSRYTRVHEDQVKAVTASHARTQATGRRAADEPQDPAEQWALEGFVAIDGARECRVRRVQATRVAGVDAPVFEMASLSFEIAASNPLFAELAEFHAIARRSNRRVVDTAQLELASHGVTAKRPAFDGDLEFLAISTGKVPRAGSSKRDAAAPVVPGAPATAAPAAVTRVPRPQVFFDIEIDGKEAGRIVFELFADIVPKTAENFRSLAAGDGPDGYSYVGSRFHRIIPGFMCQGGIIKRPDGKRGPVSLYGARFDDENFDAKHEGKGFLSMANAGPNTNGSQFFITVTKTAWLDGKHVVFGRVLTGYEVVELIEKTGTKEGKPTAEVVVRRSGMVE